MRKRLDTQFQSPKVKSLDASLRKYIVGQDPAIEQIVNIYQTYLAGISSPGQPIGNFLFLGPTGTGKTRIVEAVSQHLFGDTRAVIKVDCAEFQHSHEIAKLIGSPPGYLGHRDTHPMLSQEVLQQYYTENCKMSIVLFDEIEKASDALWNLLLGVLDKASLTLGDNRRVDFSRAMIFMTSNLGARQMGEALAPPMGFCQTVKSVKHADLSKIAIEAARKKFTPEFMNRINKMVVFQSLGKKELAQILDLELNEVRNRLQNGTPRCRFELSAGARRLLLKEGFDQKYGARPLKRAIERLLVDPLASLLASEQLMWGDFLHIGCQGDSLIFERDVKSSVRTIPGLLGDKAA